MPEQNNNENIKRSIFDLDNRPRQEAGSKTLFELLPLLDHCDNKRNIPYSLTLIPDNDNIQPIEYTNST